MYVWYFETNKTVLDGTISVEPIRDVLFLLEFMKKKFMLKTEL